MITEFHMRVVNVNDIYEWLGNHGFIVTRTQRLYKDYLILEAQRP